MGSWPLGVPRQRGRGRQGDLIIRNGRRPLLAEGARLVRGY